MDETDVNSKWQDEMAIYTSSNDIPIDGAHELTEYFYLGANREGNAVTAGGSEATAVAAPTWSPQDWTGGGELTAAGLKRTCFQMRFEAVDLGQYLTDHETVWPEMQEALVECGWHNYSLFFKPDGFAVGYFETEVGFEDACARMDSMPVNEVWQEQMSKYTPKNTSPIDAAQELTHYFYLGTDTQ